MSIQRRRRSRAGTRSCFAVRALLGSLLIAAGGLGCAELGIDPAALDAILATQTSAGYRPSQSQVASGLREALRVGTERTVATTSAPGGFLDDPLLRIALPEDLEKPAQAARAIGFGRQVDALEVTMNRAAEQASAEATEVFWEAIGRMSIQDAFQILDGPDDAATQYFRGATEDSLRARFEPIVTSAMRQVGVYRAYDGLLARYSALRLFGDPRDTLDDHVTNATLDGLFTVLATEERRIREDPAARTTELLQQVFGR